MGIGIKYAGFTGWAILIFGKGDWVIDMASLRGSKTYLALTSGSLAGLLMCRPAGACFCGFASGPDGDWGKICWIYWMGYIDFW